MNMTSSVPGGEAHSTVPVRCGTPQPPTHAPYYQPYEAYDGSDYYNSHYQAPKPGYWDRQRYATSAYPHYQYNMGRKNRRDGWMQRPQIGVWALAMMFMNILTNYFDLRGCDIFGQMYYPQQQWQGSYALY